MTRHVARAYAAAATLLVLFVAWAVISASPWSSTAPVDPRVAALQRREVALRHEAVVVRRLVRHRWAVYRVRLSHRQRIEITVVREGHQRDGRAAAGRRRPRARTARRP